MSNKWLWLTIGAWILREGLAPWPTGHPPELELEPLGDARFRLYK